VGRTEHPGARPRRGSRRGLPLGRAGSWLMPTAFPPGLSNPPPPVRRLVDGPGEGPRAREDGMAKYLLLYTGGSMPETEAEQAAVMKAWDGWFHQLGSAVADGGNPTSGKAKQIASDGAVSDDVAAPASGYSIIEADSLD